MRKQAKDIDFACFLLMLFFAFYSGALPVIDSLGVGNAAVGLHSGCWIGIVMGTENSIKAFGQIDKNTLERLKKWHG
jgi:hypothetical protein